ncbi:MAG: hypothetical protein V7L05_09715 [Nostoc sp.]|uniref:hypothetical protein n=1 Tax=Nostoc sp. TaxID=1180 RepID=UPI002FF6E4F2
MLSAEWGSKELGETRLIASVQEFGVIKIHAPCPMPHAPCPMRIYAIFSSFFNAKRASP